MFNPPPYCYCYVCTRAPVLHPRHMVCGKKGVDVDLLEKHHQVDGASDRVVKMLFKALRSFTDEEREMFLEFVWGRSRLPTGTTGWTHKFRISRFHCHDDDNELPRSHTCFFAIDMPDYSSYEVLRKNVLIASTYWGETNE